MADKESKAPALFSIEELAEKYSIKPWAKAGLMAENRWASGKQLTEAEFETAVSIYLKTPMSGSSQ